MYIWVICVIFFYVCMPEIKGLSLEELDELFFNKASIKDFAKCHCVVVDEAILDVQVNTGLFKGKYTALSDAEHIETRAE